MSYLAANIILQAMNLGVFYIFGGVEALPWAVAFGIIIQLLPSNTVFINKNSVYSAGMTLLALRIGTTYVQAFVIGAVIAVLPLFMIGVVRRMISESLILPSIFVIILYHLGMSPLHAYVFSSFIVAKIYLLIAANSMLMQNRNFGLLKGKKINRSL